MNKISIVFFGTPDFSVPSLKKLNENSNIDIKAVVTKVDKPSGRGEKINISKVKEYASKTSLLILQPERIKNNEEFEHKLQSLNADYFIVVAYGKILPKNILTIPKKACINGHASLLPKYRGSSPIQYTILSGDKIAGTTIMLMSEKCDEGDILLKKQIELDKKETSQSLFDKLANLTAEGLNEVLLDFDYFYDKREAQNNSQASYTKIIQKEDGIINFELLEAKEVDRLIRAMNSWPTAYCIYNDKILKIWDCDIIDSNEIDHYLMKNKIVVENPDHLKKVGSFNFFKHKLIIPCKKDFISVNEVQLESKKRMKIEDFINGQKIFK